MLNSGNHDSFYTVLTSLHGYWSPLPLSIPVSSVVPIHHAVSPRHNVVGVMRHVCTYEWRHGMFPSYNEAMARRHHSWWRGHKGVSASCAVCCSHIFMWRPHQQAYLSLMSRGTQRKVKQWNRLPGRPTWPILVWHSPCGCSLPCWFW